MENTEIVKMVLSGKTLPEVAKAAGVSRQRVHQILKRAGHMMKPLRENNPRLYSRRKMYPCKCKICKKEFTSYFPRKSCSDQCLKALKKLIGDRTGAWYKKMQKVEALKW